MKNFKFWRNFCALFFIFAAFSLTSCQTDAEIDEGHPPVFKIVYENAEGATFVPSDYVKNYDIRKDVTLPILTKEGWNFEGWFTTKDFAEGTKITGWKKGREGDVTLYAKWTQKAGENQNTLALDLSGYWYPGNDEKYTVTATETKVTVSHDAPLGATYNNTNHDIDFNGKNVLGLTVENKGTEKAWLQFNVNCNSGTPDYTTLKKNIKSATIDGNPVELTLEDGVAKYGVDVTLEPGAKKKVVFVLDTSDDAKLPNKLELGYDSNPDTATVASGTIEITNAYITTDESTEPNIPTPPDPTTYTITYNTAGAELPAGATKEFTADDDVTLPADLAKEGFTFGGWYTNSDFSGTAITGWAAGEKTEDVKLYAKWTQVQTSDPEPDAELSGKTAAWIIENMGAGWNLGNTLDANVESADQKFETETLWHMPETTEAMIEAVAKAGFKHIRAPVSWHNHYDTTTGKIDSAWLSRVKTIVDWCIKYNLFVVINIHHDTWKGSGDFWGYSVDGTHDSASTTFVQNVWKEVATYFKDYDQHLVFETLNEPRVVGHKISETENHEWTYNASCSTCQDAAARINELNATALSAIRTAGSNNTDRLVIVTPYVASPWAAKESAFVLPTDTVPNRLALSVHAYTPYNFAGNTDTSNGAVDSFTDAVKSGLDEIFEYAINLSTIPVFIGEYGATNKNNLAARISWVERYKENVAAVPKKAAFCLWDNMIYNLSSLASGQEDNPSEYYGVFKRTDLSWYEPTYVKAITGYTPGTAPITPSTTRTALGLSGFAGWGKYDVTDATDTGV